MNANIGALPSSVKGTGPNLENRSTVSNARTCPLYANERDYSISVYLRSFADCSVGPESPRGSRLGPDRLNTVSGLVWTSMITPMKQLLISSQFCGPHTISFVGSGLKRLF